MLSCKKICDSLSKFSNEKKYTINGLNVLFEQSPNFNKKYLQLVEDKIKENDWIDPNLEPETFSKNVKESIIQQQQAEDENIESKLDYRDMQNQDLPMKYRKLIKKERLDDQEIYYYGITGTDTFLASVLLAVEPDYWILHRKKRKEYTNQMKNSLNIEKQDLIKTIHKKSKGFQYIEAMQDIEEKDVFPINRDSDKCIEFRFLISLYYPNINILVLDLDQKKGTFVGDYKKEKRNIIIFKDHHYLPVLSNKDSTFSDDEIKLWESEFNIYYDSPLTQTKSISNTNKSGKVLKADQLDLENLSNNSFYAQSRYSLTDLQEIADKLKIDSHNKKKSELYSDIMGKISG